jgi:hypothetical protein
MTLYIFLQGGLGNQLFQYAAALILQGTKPHVAIIKAPFAHSGRDYRPSLYYRVPSVDAAPQGAHIIQLDPFPPWKPEDYKAYNIVLQGYFQYLPAIESVLPLLRQDLLSLLAPNRDAMRAKYAIGEVSSVGFLHVRRGDYLKAPPNLHWIMDTEYYRKALMNVPTNLRWFVLSDDLAWCKEQELFTDFRSIQIVDEPDELDGLALMSLCHGGAVLANSTYSWWGAMLGAELAAAPVVYPSMWFSDAKPELFPSRWIRL